MEKIVGNIYATYNYAAFKKLIGNRNVNHEKAIIESIKEYGDLRIPITVNEKMEVIDGQNTLEARKAMNLPVYYHICEGYGIKECIAMNTTSRNWGIEDYINCYAEYGYEDYVILRNLEREYGEIIPKQLIRSVALGVLSSIPTNRIRAGVFKCGVTEEYARKELDFLTGFNIPKTARGNTKLLYYVLRFCYESERIDNTKLYQQWEKNSVQIIGVTDIKQAAELIEKIYNYHCSKNYEYIATEYRKEAEKRSATGVPGGGRSCWDKG